MTRSLMLLMLGLAASPAAGQTAGRPVATRGLFPASRNHQEQYLRRPIRLPLEALLEVRRPSELMNRSLGKTPVFASAPAPDKPTDPFSGGGLALGSRSDSPAAPVPQSLPGPDESGAPFDAAGPDPFDQPPAPRKQPAADDPFSGGDPFDGGDPFGGDDVFGS